MKMLTTEEKAEELSLSTRTLKQWRLDGVGPKWKKFGRAVRYYPEVMPTKDQQDSAA